MMAKANKLIAIFGTLENNNMLNITIVKNITDKNTWPNISFTKNSTNKVIIDASLKAIYVAPLISCIIESQKAIVKTGANKKEIIYGMPCILNNDNGANAKLKNVAIPS